MKGNYMTLEQEATKALMIEWLNTIEGWAKSRKEMIEDSGYESFWDGHPVHIMRTFKQVMKVREVVG